MQINVVFSTEMIMAIILKLFAHYSIFFTNKGTSILFWSRTLSWPHITNVCVLYMCMCVCVCIHTNCIYLSNISLAVYRIHTSIWYTLNTIQCVSYTRVCVYDAHWNVYTHMYTHCVCVFTHTGTLCNTWVYIHTGIHMYLYKYVYTHTCIYTCI